MIFRLEIVIRESGIIIVEPVIIILEAVKGLSSNIVSTVVILQKVIELRRMILKQSLLHPLQLLLLLDGK